MHTLNVKTAAQESTGRWWHNTLRFDGYVTNVRSDVSQEIVSIEEALCWINGEAIRRGALFEEIYEREILRLSIEHMEALPLTERPAFINAAWEKGISLSYDEMQLREAAYTAFMKEYTKELL